MWNLTSGNGHYTLFNKELQDISHRQKIREMRASVDSRPPKTPQHHTTAKRQRLIKDRNTEIEEHNRILLKKMLSIDLKPSPLNPSSLTHTPHQPSLNRPLRFREAKKIADANRSIIKRLKSATSVYSTRRWENDRQYKVYLRDNISRNSGRVMRPKTAKSDHDMKEFIGSILKPQEARPKTSSVGLDSDMFARPLK